MKTNIWITAAILSGIAANFESAFAREDANKGSRNNNPGRQNQAPRNNQGGGGGGGRAVQNPVQNQARNQFQAQQTKPQVQQQFRPQTQQQLRPQVQQQPRQNLNQQAMPFRNQGNQNQVNQGFQRQQQLHTQQQQAQQQQSQHRNLINQQLNHAHQQVQRNQVPNQTNQAQHQNLQNQLSDQRHNQLNQNLQDRDQHAARRNLGNQSNTGPGQQGITGHQTMRPNLNQIPALDPDRFRQSQQDLNQAQLNQRSRQNQNQPRPNLNQNLNPGRFPDRDRQNALNQTQQLHRNAGPNGLNPHQLNQNQSNQIRQHQNLQNTVGLNNLAHYRRKVIGGPGFTPLYAAGHHHHQQQQYGDGQQLIANRMRFGNRQIYLSRANYAPSYRYHPNSYRGYWNLNYDNNFAGSGYGWNGGYPYPSYSYLPYFWGLGGWGLGSLAYGCGYTNYYNPYYAVSPTTVVYDYAQPIPVAYNTDVVAVEPNEGATTDQVLGLAIEAFKLNDYDRALDLVNNAIKQHPDDAVLHEFRGLVLFAKGDYQQAAATVHSILAVGPGWNWSTLSGMYADVGIYTGQLRSLEATVKANPDDPASRFLLSYHYMSDGYPEAASSQLQKVVSLVPNDQVSANLLKMLKPPVSSPTTNPNIDINTDSALPSSQQDIDLPSPDPIDEVPDVDPQSIVGEWKATRSDGSAFLLSLTEGNKFVWTFTAKDKPPTSFEGKYTLEGNTIALEREGGGSMVGQITENDGRSFNFKMVGAPDEDPGLDFAR